jgi:hypothetical protein
MSDVFPRCSSYTFPGTLADIASLHKYPSHQLSSTQRSNTMNQSRQMLLDDLQYYFVTKQTLPDGSIQLALSSYAPYSNDLICLSFETEDDTALYLLQEHQRGAVVSSNDITIADAIIRGEAPLFLYEERQPDGKLLLSLHTQLPPEDSKGVVFGSRSPQLIARHLLRRLHESPIVQATEATIKQAQTLMG